MCCGIKPKEKLADKCSIFNYKCSIFNWGACQDLYYFIVLRLSGVFLSVSNFGKILSQAEIPYYFSPHPKWLKCKS
jgi:hypothetical protein